MTLAEKPTVLILGARGMLGTDLAQAWVGQARLYLWDREEIDVTDERQVTMKITDLAPSLVLNVTGYTDVDGAEEHPDSAFQVNDRAVRFMVQAATTVGAKFVHFSTEYVFDGAMEHGYDETAPTHPLNVYGASKAAGERHVVAYSQGYLVRTSWLYGRAAQRGKPRGLNFVETVLRRATRQPEVRVVNDQYGKLTSTSDLATAVRNLVLSDHPAGIYHLVNEDTTTWYDVAREAFAIRGITTPLVPVPSTAYPAKAHRPRYGILKNTKLTPLRSWQEALREYLDSGIVGNV